MDGHHKGRTRHSITLDALFAYCPAARAAYEAQQAAARPDPTPVFRLNTLPVQKVKKQDSLTVVIRADAQALLRHDHIRAARLAFLERAIRPLMKDCHPLELRRFHGGLPMEFRQAALRWLLTSDEGQALATRLGKTPSTDTIARWWQLLIKDPSGNSLKPAHSAAGRPRKTDQAPELDTIIMGAFGRCRTYRGTAEYLQTQGIAISEATIRRFFARQDPVVERALLDGERKAMLDHGPYVLRAKSLPFQCFSADGHTVDRLVVERQVHPGEELRPFRPAVYVVYDIGSGAPIGMAVGRTLNRYLVLKAIATSILRYRLVPECVQTDNGSEVKNTLFWDKKEDHDYFEALGSRWTLSLPYNAKSKPVERENLEIKRRFSALFPAYTGGNPSERPGDPLDEAIRNGHVDTLETLELQIEAWRRAECQRIRVIKGRRIHPQRALEEMHHALLEELGPDHPRFIREHEEWRVIPGLPARVVAGFVTVKVESRTLRYGARNLLGLSMEGLEVRLNPWDVRQAWLTRGNDLVAPLAWMPDAPALGERPVFREDVDVTQLREANNAKRTLRKIIKRGTDATKQLFALEGKLGGAWLAEAHANTPEPILQPIELTDEDRALAEKEKALLGVKETPTTPAVEIPSSREELTGDPLQYLLYVIHHPDQCDSEEVDLANQKISADSDLRRRLERALGYVPAPIPIDEEPASGGRSQIQTDLDWVLYVLNHPEDASHEEIREVNQRLRSDTALQLQLQNRLGQVPQPIPQLKEA